MASIRTLKNLPEKLEDISSNGQKFDFSAIRTNVLDPLNGTKCLQVKVNHLIIKLVLINTGGDKWRNEQGDERRNKLGGGS